ncbi:hypothetical protein SAMN02745127_02750 [Oceanospirillum multiglobuliferum]|uniref:YEATS-Like-Associating Three TM domain-containing protein n=1 Tax=Oceanospirillum multiglobuliferum TaxID=64969 RepID=A0A1T4S4S9_9GAMM|nr:YEATS-associated helix-containing protein [Oceanospirillum multiglobuliferum]OPX54438.1 hypothetical protein BTE48_14060 [Oceanospirillum multiglobuliferum]SKA23233.1 hypothetical protein SAMN02745127_02750 [Oceanospirillum multiglobuliferum]
MVAHVVILTVVMLLAGVFGGLINYYLLNQNNKDTAAIARCLVVGVGASFLVPVVLDMVGSNIVVLSQSDSSKMLIYTGICLIAAIGSRVVVTNTVDRTMLAAESAKTSTEELRLQLKQLQDAIVPLLETETERDDTLEVSNLELDSLDVSSTAVLKSLASGRHIYRALHGLSKETEFDETDLQKSLSVLVGKGLAGRVNGGWGVRWYITERGRKLSETLV